MSGKIPAPSMLVLLGVNQRETVSTSEPPLRSKRVYGTKLVIIADVNDPQLRRLLDMLAADAESPPLLKS